MKFFMVFLFVFKVSKTFEEPILNQHLFLQPSTNQNNKTSQNVSVISNPGRSALSNKSETTVKRSDSLQDLEINTKYVALVLYKGGKGLKVFKHRTLPRYYIKPLGFLIPGSLSVYEDILTGSHQLLFDIEMWNEEVRAVVAHHLSNDVS